MNVKYLTLEKSTSPKIQEERKIMKYFVLKSRYQLLAHPKGKAGYVPKQIKVKMKDIPNSEVVKNLAKEYFLDDIPVVLQEYSYDDYKDFTFPKEVEANV